LEQIDDSLNFYLERRELVGELVVGADSAIVTKDEEVEASRFHLTAGGWQHVPIQSYDVVVTDRSTNSFSSLLFC
jgi:hypothetical protein